MGKNRFGLTRKIPPEVKRRVRSRDGFGCVVCGNALVQYDHFDPEFADAEEHRVDGIALLCLEHHEQKKGGLFPEEVYRRARETPQARTMGHAKRPLETWSRVPPELVMGVLTLASGTSLVRIGNEVVLGIAPPEEISAPPRLTLRFSDRRGTETLAIKDNEILAYSAAWDVSCKNGASEWVVRSATGRVDLRLRFDMPTRITVERLIMRHGRWGLRVDRTKLAVAFDDKAVTTIRGPAKVRGDCLFALEESRPGVSMGGRIEYSKPPAPLGTELLPEGGWRLRWPVYVAVFGGFPNVIKHDGRRILVLYTRSGFAERARRTAKQEESRIESLGYRECLYKVARLGQDDRIDFVGFNLGVDHSAQAHAWTDFVRILESQTT